MNIDNSNRGKNAAAGPASGNNFSTQTDSRHIQNTSRGNTISSSKNSKFKRYSLGYFVNKGSKPGSKERVPSAKKTRTNNNSPQNSSSPRSFPPIKSPPNAFQYGSNT